MVLCSYRKSDPEILVIKVNYNPIYGTSEHCTADTPIV